MRRRFKCDPKWIAVWYLARCAEPNCQTEIKPGERAFYHPSDKALYGTRCGQREGWHGTEEQCVTSGGLTESPGGTGVSRPISASEMASEARSVVGRRQST